MPLAEAFTRLSVKVSAGRMTDEDLERSRRPNRDRSAIPSVDHVAVDVVLLKDMPMAQVAAELLRYLRKTFEDFDGAQYDRIRERLADPWAYWQVVSPTGQHYDAELPLSQSGLSDGDMVALVDSHQRENYRPLMDDIADSIAQDQTMYFQEWGSKHGRSLAGMVAPLAALTAVVALVWGVAGGALGEIGQYIGGGALLFAAILALVGASTSATGDAADVELQRVQAGVITSGYVCVAGAGLLLVPSSPNGFSFILAGGLLAASAWIINRVVEFPAAVNFAAMFAGAITAVGAALSVAVDAGPLGTAMFTAALTVAFVAILSSSVARSSAKIEVPEIPAQGQTFLRDEHDLTSFDNATRNEVISEIINQKDRSITARGILVGAVWGPLILLLISAGVTGFVGMNGSTSQGIFVLIFWTAIVLGLLFRGKSSGDAVQQGSWLGGAFAIGAVFTIASAASGGRIELTLIAAGLLVIGSLVGMWAAVRVKAVEAAPRQRMLEWAETACFAVIPPMWAFTVDLIGTVRGMM